MTDLDNRASAVLQLSDATPPGTCALWV